VSWNRGRFQQTSGDAELAAERGRPPHSLEPRGAIPRTIQQPMATSAGPNAANLVEMPNTAFALRAPESPRLTWPMIGGRRIDHPENLQRDRRAVIPAPGPRRSLPESSRAILSVGLGLPTGLPGSPPAHPTHSPAHRWPSLRIPSGSWRGSSFDPNRCWRSELSSRRHEGTERLALMGMLMARGCPPVW
jgi:hypothetical protein